MRGGSRDAHPNARRRRIERRGDMEPECRRALPRCDREGGLRRRGTRGRSRPRRQLRRRVDRHRAARWRVQDFRVLRGASSDRRCIGGRKLRQRDVRAGRSKSSRRGMQRARDDVRSVSRRMCRRRVRRSSRAGTSMHRLVPPGLALHGRNMRTAAHDGGYLRIGQRVCERSLQRRALCVRVRCRRGLLHLAVVRRHAATGNANNASAHGAMTSSIAAR